MTVQTSPKRGRCGSRRVGSGWGRTRRVAVGKGSKTGDRKMEGPGVTLYLRSPIHPVPVFSDVSEKTDPHPPLPVTSLLPTSIS